jgi:hypothetical protein
MCLFVHYIFIKYCLASNGVSSFNAIFLVLLFETVNPYFDIMKLICVQSSVIKFHILLLLPDRMQKVDFFFVSC